VKNHNNHVSYIGNVFIFIFLCIFFLESVFQFLFDSIFFEIESSLINLSLKIFLIFFPLMLMFTTKYYLRVDKSILYVIFSYTLVCFLLFIEVIPISSFFLILDDPFALFQALLFNIIIIVFSFYMFRYKSQKIGRALSLFFIINALTLLAQVLGLNESLFIFQNYVEPHNFLGSNSPLDYSFLQDTYSRASIPGEQLRPPGLFTNTIYLTLFLLTFFGYLIFYEENSSIFLFFFAGLMIPLSGSTMVIIIAIIALLSISFNKKMIWFVCGLLLSIVLIYYYLPFAFSQNYSFNSGATSVAVRLDIESTNIEQFRYNFNLSNTLLVLATLFFSYKILSIKKNLIILFLFLFIMLAPLTLNPIFLYSKYCFIIGMSFAGISKNYVSNYK